MSSGRYAPSPTGQLHLGNLRTALLAWLHARLSCSVFILRIDDLDAPRNRPGSLEQIIEDLHWLGLDWDEGPDVGGDNGPYLQSQRLEFYERAFVNLQGAARVFPCRCSRKDITHALSAPHLVQIAPIYPGTCRPANFKNRVPGQRGNWRGTFAWRFAVGDKVIHYEDKLWGRQQQNLGNAVGDFVVKRRDGLYAYQLASVVDDGLMGVTDVVRGEDLLDSTPRQIALMKALNILQPNFWHVPLLQDDFGQRMSKRDGSNSLEQWRVQNYSPAKLVGNFAYTLGLIDSNKALTAKELLHDLSLDGFRQKLRIN